jgi:chemotaxis-related protein WspB
MIVPALPLRAVPGTPPAVVGVFAFRNQVTPVIDLAQLALGQPARPAMSSRYVVTRFPLAGGTERFLALLAERVNEVCDVPDDRLRPPGVRSPGAPFLGPVADTPGGLVQTVTLAQLLPPELQALLFAEEPAAPSSAP